VAFTVNGERVEFTDPLELSQAEGSVPAGHTVTFEVLRHGRMLKVPILLAPRPLEVREPLNLNEFNGRREDQANEVWERDFAPMLGERLI